MNITPKELTIEGGLAAIVGAVLFKVLPVIAAILPIIYWGIKIYETKSVQNWRHARRQKRGSH